MRKFNRLTAGVLCALLAAALVIPAAAHGHHGGRGHHGAYVQAVDPQPAAACPYGDCTITGQHYHDNMLYCGYGRHSAYTQPQETQPQYTQPAVGVCPYDGCTAAGRHYHDGVPYCGYGHAGAYCDGTCAGYCAGNAPAGSVGSYAFYGCNFGYTNGHGHHGGC